MKTMDFSETIDASDLKVGRCRQLNVFMKVCEYWRSRSFLDLCPRAFTYENYDLFFSSPEPKAHGELIGYSWSGVRRPSSVVNNYKHLLL